MTHSGYAAASGANVMGGPMFVQIFVGNSDHTEIIDAAYHFDTEVIKSCRKVICLSSLISHG